MVSDNLSHTLLNGNDQTLVEFVESVVGTLEASYYKGVNNWAERTIVSTPTEEQKVFTMDADRSNSMKSANPQSGFHEAEIAKTLDCTVPTPQKAQGGQMVVAYENNPTDARQKETDISPTVMSRWGTGGNQTPLVQTVGCDLYNQKITNDVSASVSANSCMTATRNGPSVIQSCYPINSMIIGKDVKLTDRQTTGIGEESDPSPTLQANHHHAVAIAENIIGRQDHTGGNGVGAQDELAYTQNTVGVMGVASINCQGSSGVNIQEETTETITAATNSSGNNLLGVCTKGNGDAFLSDVHTSLSASGGGQAGQGYPACCSTSTVRRLLPVECERLMGFPDGHTQIAWNGKPAEDCPDAPRYKACGNSMCVNVMEWIGRRIQMVEDEA